MPHPLTRLRPISRRLLSLNTTNAHLHRPFSSTLPLKAEGSTGSMRSGGERSADTFSRREKAAEDMYIREREKQIVILLREKIAEQEAVLARDREVLSAMEDQYGHHAEGGERGG